MCFRFALLFGESHQEEFLWEDSTEKNFSRKKGWAARAMPESPPAPLETARPFF